MNWNHLELEVQIAAINEESKAGRVIIFKHSTRCSISHMAKARLEKLLPDGEGIQALKPYMLDLLAFRSVSNEVATHYKVEHESPQVLVIENGRCIQHESHHNINADAVEAMRVSC